MRRDVLVAETFRKMARDALRVPPRVDEDERGAVGLDELRQPVVKLLPHFARHHRFERRGRHLDLQIAHARVARIDDGAVFGRAPRADQKARDFLDRFLGRGQAHAHQRFAGERFEPFQRQREMAAALGSDDRVDLVDDHRARGRKHAPARIRAEHHVERFRRRNDDVRRALAHALPVRLWRVAGAHDRADIDVRVAQML
jgi:hypothetical protein